MNPPVGSSIRLGGIGRLQTILLFIGMSSFAARGESNLASENTIALDYFACPSLASYFEYEFGSARGLKRYIIFSLEISFYIDLFKFQMIVRFIGVDNYGCKHGKS